MVSLKPDGALFFCLSKEHRRKVRLPQEQTPVFLVIKRKCLLRSCGRRTLRRFDAPHKSKPQPFWYSKESVYCTLVGGAPCGDSIFQSRQKPTLAHFPDFTFTALSQTPATRPA